MRTLMNLLILSLLLPAACHKRTSPDVKPSPRDQNLETPVTPAPQLTAFHWTYQEDPRDIVSPGRGFYSWNTGDQDKGLALIRVVLTSYCGTEILDESVGRNLEQRFAEVRQVPGKQAIVRVIYADDGVLNPCGLAEAARPELAIQHLKQLAPIFKAHRYDIAFFEAGFYGMWGEWNSEYAPNGRGYAEDPQLRFQLVRALLDELPDDFLIMIRRPRFRAELESRLTPAEMKRLGFHNDCYLASETDMGTYDGDRTPDQWKDMIATLSRQGQAIGGETCVDNPVYTSCEAALQDMERLGMSYLNTGWNAKVLDRWKTEGCYDEVATRLGYRFILESAKAVVSPDHKLTLDLKIRNDGFAPAYHPFRPEIAVVNAAGVSQALELGSGEGLDPRSWLPGSTQSVRLQADVSVVPAGTFEIELRWSYQGRILRFPVQSVWDENRQTYRLGSMEMVRFKS
ncbi:DUF4832 domain-containing protein [Oligoflexus tunisiensis]|uniref:DUF4832 domain-containing protein n=1 Tax=Oligoflexus tunisiensis TaxID=708132 RepID=UPI00114D1368|nr:DUF4832 domain-containing protein [Oligoflexus tunisiensis]